MDQQSSFSACSASSCTNPTHRRSTQGGFVPSLRSFGPSHIMSGQQTVDTVRGGQPPHMPHFHREVPALSVQDSSIPSRNGMPSAMFSQVNPKVESDTRPAEARTTNPPSEPEMGRPATHEQSHWNAMTQLSQLTQPNRQRGPDDKKSIGSTLNDILIPMGFKAMTSDDAETYESDIARLEDELKVSKTNLANLHESYGTVLAKSKESQATNESLLRALARSLKSQARHQADRDVKDARINGLERTISTLSGQLGDAYCSEASDDASERFPGLKKYDRGSLSGSRGPIITLIDPMEPY